MTVAQEVEWVFISEGQWLNLRWFRCASLRVKVSLGKILNPKWPHYILFSVNVGFKALMHFIFHLTVCILCYWSMPVYHKNEHCVFPLKHNCIYFPVEHFNGHCYAHDAIIESLFQTPFRQNVWFSLHYLSVMFLLCTITKFRLKQGITELLAFC